MDKFTEYTMSQRFDAASFNLALMFIVIVLLAAPFVVTPN